MRKSLWIITLLFGVIVAPNAHADSVTDYTITFTGTAPIPTVGSFEYDNTTQTFNYLTVVWDGVRLDLTSVANNPYIGYGGPTCIGSATRAQASLALLTACGSPPELVWTASGSVTSFTVFEFYIDYPVSPSLSADGHGVMEIYPSSPPFVSEAAAAQGSFTSSVVTPEPSSVALMITGMGFLLVMRKRIA